MSGLPLKQLARSAGLHVEWTDANGRPHEVKPDTLRAVLAELGYPASTPKHIAESQHRLNQESKGTPKVIAARTRETVHLGGAKRARLRTVSGDWDEIKLQPLKIGGASFRAPDQIGYHELEIDGASCTLAVAPPRCFSIADAVGARKLSGLSVQIYSLRGGHSDGFGDFAALAEFAAGAGYLGVEAMAVSPTHAGFGADTGNIRPYSPSSRLFLDPIYADPVLAGAEMAVNSATGDDFIDWRDARRRKYAQLRAAYDRIADRLLEDNSFVAFCREGGQRLRNHAMFEALDAHFREDGKVSWHQWPASFHEPSGPGTEAFAEREKQEIHYQLWLQWVTVRSAQEAQARARQKMAIGIIADIAVGIDAVGSDAWSAPHELIGGLSIGAPPDTFNPAGQDWGLTSFSPTALRSSGYRSFVETVRAGMIHAGGIRIDHAMGLRRLWVLPKGAAPKDGVYISYPLSDLLKLIALESTLHRAIVIGEDLGTVPEGFHAQLSSAGILGMRVLWFERGRDGEFISPTRWGSQAAAYTTTHDLPTIAGWWCERDIDWAAKLKRKMRLGSVTAERRARKQDRALLWSTLTESGCAQGAEPAFDEPDAAVDGALSYVSRSSCVLALAPVEDILALAEQPNLPGTIDEHPNWRRRLPELDVWHDEKARARLKKLTAPRR